MLSVYTKFDNAIARVQEKKYLLPLNSQPVGSLIYFDSAVQNRTLCQAHCG